MKKLLLIAAATAALSTSVMAEENTVYLRVDGSMNKFQEFSLNSQKLKTKWSGGVDAGVGFFLMDNVRGEFVYAHPFNVEAKNAGANGVKHKVEINSLLLKGNVDVADLGMAKLFVGAGLGWSMIKEKVTLPNASVSSKKNNTLGWTAGGGLGCEVADGVKVDVQYAYSDFGKTKTAPYTNAQGTITEHGKNHYRAHQIKLGLRFEIPSL